MIDQDDRSLGNEEDEEQKLFEFVDVPSSGSRRGLLKRIYLLKNVFSKKESSISKGSIYTYLYPVNLDCNLRLEQDQMRTKLLFLRMNCLNHLRKLAKAIQCAERMQDLPLIHFCSFMFWNKSDQKKYDFVLVL